MYSVTKLYVENKCEVRAYDPAEFTPTELQDMSDINTRLYVSVKTEDEDVALDYSRLITDHAIVNATTWDDFNTQLTDGLVIGYTIHLPGFVPGTNYPANPVRVWDALRVLKTFNLDYSDYLSGKSNIFAFRWNLKDLKITIMDNATVFPNLRRCVPVVNGFACRPVFNDDALYGLDGAKLCWHRNNHFTPEIQLLDFTHVGDLEICNIHLDNHIDDVSVYARLMDTAFTWCFTTSKSLYEYTPILVLGGMMIFPDQYKIKSEHAITINIGKIPLQKALVLREYLCDNPCTSSGVGYTSDDFQTYLLTEFSKEISSSAFMIFVKTNRLYISREKMVSWRHGVSIDNYGTDGLLINDATGTTRNYHLSDYHNCDELTVQTTERIFIADNLFDSEQLCFIDSDCRHQGFEDLNRSRCTMLFLMGD